MTFSNLKIAGLIFVIIIATLSCKSYKKGSNPNKINEISIIDEAIKLNFLTTDSIQIIPNQEKNWELYLIETNQDSLIPVTNISFFIYDKENNKILYQNKYSRAKIKWYNNEQLLLSRELGIIDKQTGISTKSYIIDIAKNKTLEYNTNTQQNY